MASFPFLRQQNQMDCGPTCLNMISKFYGHNYSIEEIRELTQIGKEGVSILGINDAAETLGYHTHVVQLNMSELKKITLPCILHWRQNHFIVLYKIKRDRFYIADPDRCLIKYTEKEFAQNYLSNTALFSNQMLFKEIKDNLPSDNSCGIVLLLKPTSHFFDTDVIHTKPPERSLNKILHYLSPYKKLIVQLFSVLLLGSLLQLIFPFLTQSIVDVGINTNNIHFIYIVLFAQLALFSGRLSADFLKSWILYHISSRINISILDDFIIKLMKLPISYFDSKRTGDIMQRMNDHHRIQSFLTGTSLSTLFSLVNLVIYSIVLSIYSIAIFIIFLSATLLYILWIGMFLRKRRQLDYSQFDVATNEQSKIIQLVQGMQEIKLHGCERTKRWEWERLQAKIFKLGVKGLAINQWQQSGAFLINEGKNIIITFLAAKAVITGEGGMTLGKMVAIQYIIGQLNSPIEQMISFVQNWQLARISLDRFNEIHNLKDEEPADVKFDRALPINKTIDLVNISFTYPGKGNEAVLKNINLKIQQGKTTAIVGTSGSGKTTLLKLLLKFYESYKGRIKVGDVNITNLRHGCWRQSVGVVMQDGFIFSDSIAANIAVGSETIDIIKLKKAIDIANLSKFLENLPLGMNTIIGSEGAGISEGQKQRVLIARAIYKNPDYIFFDEATNNLDANNEAIIMNNMAEFLKTKTVVIVAHRLSTVKNADQIVVMNNGIITEVGTHTELTNKKGEYYTLVKNQLELGN